jgi:micrococcal nuclease
MKKFLRQNKTFFAVIIGALIIGAAIYFSSEQANNNGGKVNDFSENREGECAEIPNLPDGAEKLVTKVIDGDTFVIKGGYSVRILSIDTDERGYPCYQEAKDKLEELILGKKVKLEKEEEDVDQYCRYLRHIFLPTSTEVTADKDNENVGIKLVEEGLAVARFYSETKYQEEISEAEKNARENKIGCKWTSFASAESSADKSDSVGTSEDNHFHWEKLTSESTGMEIVGACQAENYLGEEKIVQGKIASAYCSKTNTVFLNFGNAYPKQCFVAVIFNSYRDKFVKNPEKYYADKTVRIKGKISEYQGKPQIILKNSEQIEIGKAN